MENLSVGQAEEATNSTQHTAWYQSNSRVKDAHNLNSFDYVKFATNYSASVQFNYLFFFFLNL